MYERLTGTLVAKSPPNVVIDCHGVGYEVSVPMSSFYDLPETGQHLVLLTHFVVREDAQLLFGFLREDERATFRQLIKISGVGARTALSILSGMSSDDLRNAVVMQDAGRLTKVPGIGKKTAERLLLELKGAWSGSVASRANGTPASSQDDISQALTALGYSEREVRAAIGQLPAGATVSDGIRQALTFLAKT